MAAVVMIVKIVARIVNALPDSSTETMTLLFTTVAVEADGDDDDLRQI